LKELNSKNTAHNELVIEFFNLLIETEGILANRSDYPPKMSHMPDLPINAISYVVYAHKYLLCLEQGVGYAYSIPGHRIDTQDDVVGYKMYQTTKDFGYWLDALAKDTGTQERLKKIYEKHKITFPVYEVFKD
jgi:hypothetical protein